MTYELTFAGAASVSAYKLPRHRRKHANLEAARAEAERVLAEMDLRDLPRAAHPAVIYGPEGETSVA